MPAITSQAPRTPTQVALLDKLFSKKRFITAAKGETSFKITTKTLASILGTKPNLVNNTIGRHPIAYGGYLVAIDKPGRFLFTFRNQSTPAYTETVNESAERLLYCTTDPDRTKYLKELALVDKERADAVRAVMKNLADISARAHAYNGTAAAPEPAIAPEPAKTRAATWQPDNRDVYLAVRVLRHFQQLQRIDDSNEAIMRNHPVASTTADTLLEAAKHLSLKVVENSNT